MNNGRNIAGRKSPAERKQAERDRHREAGRVAVTVWVKPVHRQKLRQIAKTLQ